MRVGLFLSALVVIMSCPASSHGQLPQEVLSEFDKQFVRVDSGEFMMGSNEGDVFEKPVHKVRLTRPFFISRYETTQKVWIAVMESNPSSFVGTDRPVEKVSWNHCQRFISKLNQLTGRKYRLPTEAEWEYAARGGNKSQGFKYAGSNDPGEAGWTLDNAKETQPVGGKKPNELGLFDMTGNVYEWCEDAFDTKFYSVSPESDPLCDEPGDPMKEYRVLRGGSWNDGKYSCRSASRFRAGPENWDRSVGFRLVRE